MKDKLYQKFGIDGSNVYNDFCLKDTNNCKKCPLNTDISIFSNYCYNIVIDKNTIETLEEVIKITKKIENKLIEQKLMGE